MTTLVQAALTARRAARTGYRFAVAAAFALLCWLGAFSVRPEEIGLEHGLALVLWLVVFAQGAQRRMRDTNDAAPRLDLELGFLLLVAVHAVIQIAGGLTETLYPLVYVLVAFFASFARKPMGTTLVLSAVAIEAPLYFLTEGRTDPKPFALHAVFIVFFGLLNLVFTRVEIARVRETSRRELDDEKKKVRDDARLYRLVGAATDSQARDEERVYRSSVEEVREATYHTLDLLKRTLDLHTCILLLRDEKTETLRVVELSTDSDDITQDPISEREGAVGAVASRGIKTNLEHVRPGYKGLSYYKGPSTVRAFLGVPVLDDGVVRGALCCDRLDDRAFSSKEETVVESATHQVLRALRNERLFLQLERGKREQAMLYRASQALGAALSEDAVLDAGLSAASEIAPYDFAAVTLYDREDGKHLVRKAVGTHGADLEGLTFRDNTSLTAMAVKNRHYLPYRGEHDPKQIVFTKRHTLPGMESLLVLPLLVRDDAIGTLCLAAQRKDAFGADKRPILQVLATQLAVSLSNATAVRRLEQLATTDGLTGCLNKRAFHDELERKLRSAERFGKKLSLLVTDIDHFKGVNDVYGHATGDVVIKHLGALLSRVKRETDVVARFGGEEFCVLCEETDTEGALQLAERIREELSAHTFQTELGKLRVTTSIGVATFPRDAKTKEHLFESADKALYAAKHGGRNRVCTASTP